MYIGRPLFLSPLFLFHLFLSYFPTLSLFLHSCDQGSTIDWPPQFLASCFSLRQIHLSPHSLGYLNNIQRRGEHGEFLACYRIILFSTLKSHNIFPVQIVYLIYLCFKKLHLKYVVRTVAFWLLFFHFDFLDLQLSSLRKNNKNQTSGVDR